MDALTVWAALWEAWWLAIGNATTQPRAPGRRP